MNNDNNEFERFFDSFLNKFGDFQKVRHQEVVDFTNNLSRQMLKELEDGCSFEDYMESMKNILREKTEQKIKEGDPTFSLDVLGCLSLQMKENCPESFCQDPQPSTDDLIENYRILVKASQG